MAIDIVLDLDFWSGLPWCALCFENVIHQTAIATLGNFILKDEFKTVVLFFGDDIASTLLDPNDSVVLNLPTIT